MPKQTHSQAASFSSPPLPHLLGEVSIKPRGQSRGSNAAGLPFDRKASIPCLPQLGEVSALETTLFFPVQVPLVSLGIIFRVDWRKGRAAHTPGEAFFHWASRILQAEAPLETEEPSGSELKLWSQPVWL